MRRLHVTPRLESLMRYPKFQKSTRLLVLKSSYWVDVACLRAAAALGWETRETPVVMEGTMPRAMIEELLYSIAGFRPDFVLSVNLAGMDEGGLLAGFLEDLRLPRATWFVDNPRTIVMDRECYGGTFSAAFSWERSYLPFLGERHFGLAQYLPLAADPAFLGGDGTPEAQEAPPAFVGSSMTDYARREMAWLRDAERFERMAVEALAGGRVTRAAFGEGLETIFGREAVGGLDAEMRRHLEMTLFLEGTRRLRHSYLGTLAADGVEVYGDSGWEAAGIRPGAPVAYGPELAAFYRCRSVNLNVTSIQMATAVNQRVFDCPAAGGFLLTDAQADLATLFDVEEVAVYGSLEEARERLQHFAKDVDARRRIVEKARRRILAEHRYEHRLLRMRAVLAEHFGSG